MASTVRDTVQQHVSELLEEEGSTGAEPLRDDDVLLESGLDSLGFAVLVTRLEDDLGVDPFTEMDEPVYPRTFGEFVALYEQAVPSAAE